MDKTAYMKLAADIPGVLRESATHMRKMASDNAKLEKRATDAEHELRLYKIARRMEERGLEANLDHEGKLAALRGIPDTKLAGFEQAIELAAGGLSIGRVSEENKTSSEPASLNDFDDFIASGRAYT